MASMDGYGSGHRFSVIHFPSQVDKGKKFFLRLLPNHGKETPGNHIGKVDRISFPRVFGISSFKHKLRLTFYGINDRNRNRGAIEYCEKMTSCV